MIAEWRAGTRPRVIAARLDLARDAVKAVVDTHASAEDEMARRSVHAARAAQRSQKYTDQQLLDAVRGVVESLGCIPSGKEYGRLAQRPDVPSLATIEARFGGWNACARAAALTPTNARNPTYPIRWTEEACLRALRAVVAEHGGLPPTSRYAQLAKGRDDLPSLATVRKRVGPWSAVALRLGG